MNEHFHSVPRRWVRTPCLLVLGKLPPPTWLSVSSMRTADPSWTASSHSKRVLPASWWGGVHIMERKVLCTLRKAFRWTFTEHVENSSAEGTLFPSCRSNPSSFFVLLSVYLYRSVFLLQPPSPSSLLKPLPWSSASSVITKSIFLIQNSFSRLILYIQFLISVKSWFKEHRKKSHFLWSNLICVSKPKKYVAWS